MFCAHGGFFLGPFLGESEDADDDQVSGEGDEAGDEADVDLLRRELDGSHTEHLQHKAQGVKYGTKAQLHDCLKRKSQWFKINKKHKITILSQAHRRQIARQK
jgi:hypothetical protein